MLIGADTIETIADGREQRDHVGMRASRLIDFIGRKGGTGDTAIITSAILTGVGSRERRGEQHGEQRREHEHRQQRSQQERGVPQQH